MELASVLAGPSVAQFLAELGANVIKVESTRTNGDVTRGWKLPSEAHIKISGVCLTMVDLDLFLLSQARDSDLSAYFSACNWGKRSMAVDLAQEGGREVVQRMAAECDIVVVSYKPGDAEKLGVDYKSLSRTNEKLIYAEITGYGSADKRVGYDAVIQAESGFTYMNGEADGEKGIKMPVALVDVLAAHSVKQGEILYNYVQAIAFHHPFPVLTLLSRVRQESSSSSGNEIEQAVLAKEAR